MANPQLPIGQTEDDDNVFFDLLAAPFRGVEGAVQGVYNLADLAAFDILPDYDEKFLGTSTTVAGSAVEGISQFMTGFVPIFGWAGRAGNLAKAGSLTQKALSGTVSRGAIAGAVTDFTMFNGQEARLSNFIQQYPELQNPVTDFLAHDEDEGEIEGRIKNVLEGLGLEFAALGFVKGLKSMKRGKKIRAEGGSPEEVAKGMQEPFGEEGVKLMPDFAYHGTSQTFKAEEGAPLGKFKTSQMGTGVGGQEFGRGLYFAGKKEVAEHYRKMQSDKGTLYKVELAPKEDSYLYWDKTLEEHPKELKEKLYEILKSVRGRPFDQLEADKLTGENVYGMIVDHFTKIDPLQDAVNTSRFLKEADIPGIKYLEDRFSTSSSGKSNQDYNYVIFSEDDVTILSKDLPDFGDASKFKADALPDLMDDVSERMKEVEAPVNTFDEAIDARPPLQPFKTNLEAKRGLEGSRGATYIKNRLRKKALHKEADPEEVKDVEAFIDLIGEDMFSDVSLSITSKIAPKGRFNFGNKLLEIRKNVVEGGSLSRTMVHELWHSLSRYLPKKDVDALTKQFNRERNKYIQSFGIVVKDVDKWDLQNIKLADQPKELKDFLNGKYNEKNYRFSEIDEYFAEEMTDAFLSKLDADAKLAPQGTFKRATQEIAILFKHLFASVKSKLGIDQRQKIFNDFVKQRNIKKQRSGPLDYGFSDISTKEMKDFADEVSPEHAGIAKAITRGEGISMPRFETDDQQYSFIDSVKEEIAANDQTMEQLADEVRKNTPINTGDNDISQLLNNMEKTEASQIEIRKEAMAYKLIGSKYVEKLVGIAKEWTESGGGDLVTAKLKNTFQEMVSFSERYYRIGRQTSLTLSDRRQRMGRRKLGLTESEMKGQGIRKNFVNENGGMSVEKLVKIINETGANEKDLEKAINGLFKLSRKSQGRKFLDMPTEYWINSILSGPRTQVVNLMGNALTSVWSTLETAIGGVLTGNLDVTRHAFSSWADMSMFREAASFAKNAAKSGENLLDPDARAFNEGRTDAITPEAFGRSEGDKGYELNTQGTSYECLRVYL
jgi:hypothetical protein